MGKEENKGPCPVCGRWKNRAMTVDAVVVTEARVLLIKRNNDPYRGCWALPGGYMDFDETAEEAAMRELREETGLVAHHGECLGVFSDPERHPDQVVSAAYLVTLYQGTPVAGDDAGEAAWFGLDELPGNLAFDHANIIDAAREKITSPRGGVQTP